MCVFMQAHKHFDLKTAATMKLQYTHAILNAECDKSKHTHSTHFPTSSFAS